MKVVRRLLWIVTAAGLGACAAESAQQASRAIDEAYGRFSDAYLRLDANAVGALYTEDALYLEPGGDIVRGRAAIVEGFADFFRSVRERGREARIFFESVDRRVSGPVAYDVGYYDLLSHLSGEAVSRSRGKFVTVWKRGPYGNWRIHVDSYNQAPLPDVVDGTR